MKILNCDIVRKGPKNSKGLAITFDDGPHERYTPVLLDILEEKKGRATFFFTGQNIIDNRSLAEKVVKRGHLIANHTFSHQRALYLNNKMLRNEILRTKELIEDISGKQNRLFRPPYGIITPSLLKICSTLDLSIILWSVNSFDFRRKPADRIINRLSNKLHQGSIVLFHECHYKRGALDYSNTAVALKTLLDKGILGDLKIITIEELVKV